MSFVIIECTLMSVSNTVILEVFEGYDENSSCFALQHRMSSPSLMNSNVKYGRITHSLFTYIAHPGT